MIKPSKMRENNNLKLTATSPDQIEAPYTRPATARLLAQHEVLPGICTLPSGKFHSLPGQSSALLKAQRDGQIRSGSSPTLDGNFGI